MIKLLAFMIVAIVLVSGAQPIAFASDGPVGGCPGKFELHMAMDHDGEPGHQHVGTDTDRNGDGWICAKHVSADSTIHVHTDNNVPLR